MDNKLIPMTQFVLNEKECTPISVNQFADRVCNYANFITQPLEKWMFVPVGGDGSFLEEPKLEDYDQFEYVELMHAYNKAKERVLFEGFFINEDSLGMYVEGPSGAFVYLHSMSADRKIEYLITPSFNITLTETAFKQIKG